MRAKFEALTQGQAKPVLKPADEPVSQEKQPEPLVLKTGRGQFFASSYDAK